MQKTTVKLMDDLDGSPAQETVEFGLDGQSYVIDLNEDNAGILRLELERYIEKARRTSPTRRAAPRSSTRLSKRLAVGKEEAKAIREWAAREGHPVGARGRIADRIVQTYRQSLDPSS